MDKSLIIAGQSESVNLRSLLLESKARLESAKLGIQRALSPQNQKGLVIDCQIEDYDMT